MTTIAANKKEMSADRQVSGASSKYHTDKIFEIRGGIVGVAGSVANTTKFMQWYRRECPADVELIATENGEVAFEALVLDSTGLHYYTNLAEPDLIDDPFYAIGSGCDHALTAMALGKTPAEAVLCAHEYDPNTGEEVDTLQVPEQKKARKRSTTKPKERNDQDPPVS